MTNGAKFIHLLGEYIIAGNMLIRLSIIDNDRLEKYAHAYRDIGTSLRK
jgi:hypothetical protein